MDPVLVLEEAAVHVDPGGEARVPVTVRNIGELVEQYRFEVLGEAARWAQVLPRQVSVLPHGQEEKTVEVVFRPPPPPAAPSGEIPFGVRCVSLERRDRCAVVEGDISVGAVHNLSARLAPVKPRGRWAGRYKAQFENTGSVPVTLRLAAEDSKRMLGFALAPPELTVQPGRSAPAFLSVRPRQPMTRGRPVEHQFTVSYRSRSDERSGELPGSFEQRPVISKVVIALAVGAIALAGGVGVLLLRANNKPASAAETPGGEPPPPVQLIAAKPSNDTSVQLEWERSPYATSYVLQQVANDAVAGTKEIKEPDQTVTVWEELKYGRHCFRVVVVGTNDNRSAPSEPACTTLEAPPPPPPVVTTTPPESTAPPTGGPSTGEPTVPPTSGGTDPGGAVVLTGFYVIYFVTPKDDPGTGEAAANRVVSRLQQAGAQARRVDSLKSDQIDDGNDGKGTWAVVRDGFDTFDAAQAECNARRSIQGAEGCFVEFPS